MQNVEYYRSYGKMEWDKRRWPLVAVLSRILLMGVIIWGRGYDWGLKEVNQ